MVSGVHGEVKGVRGAVDAGREEQQRSHAEAETFYQQQQQKWDEEEVAKGAEKVEAARAEVKAGEEKARVERKAAQERLEAAKEKQREQQLQRERRAAHAAASVRVQEGQTAQLKLLTQSVHVVAAEVRGAAAAVQGAGGGATARAETSGSSTVPVPATSSVPVPFRPEAAPTSPAESPPAMRRPLAARNGRPLLSSRSGSRLPGCSLGPTCAPYDTAPTATPASGARSISSTHSYTQIYTRD